MCIRDRAGETHFILVTSFPYRLPSTIHSRCIRVDCPAPEAADVSAWLRTQHEIEEKDLSTLLLSGLGPITINELLTKGNVAAISTLVSYCLGKNHETPDSPTLTRLCEEVGADRALRILQNLTLETLRESVRQGATPAKEGIFRDLGFCLRAIRKFGSARELVGSAVDEQLTLEDICAWTCAERA